MILQKHYLLCIVFVILLTIILFGIGRVAVKMAFGKESSDKAKLLELNKKKLSLSMYIPQVMMLIIVFILGIYIPPFLNEVILTALKGF